jgi:N-methylhydantoinase B
MGDQLSQIQLQVLWNRLLSVVEEQASALIRTAFSPIVRESGDLSAGVFDQAGNMMVQAVTGTPGHINTNAVAVKNMFEHIPPETMTPGSNYVSNDPWIGTGHLNDLLLVKPVFFRGNYVGSISCTTHIVDIGGICMNPDGRDVFDEGLFIPPMALIEKGEMNSVLLSLILANSRNPKQAEGDINALLSCCDVAERRLLEMMEEVGISDLETISKHILDTSEAATRKLISVLPDGTYENQMMTDGYDFEIDLRAKMTVKGGEVEIDLDGCSGPSRYGINSPLNYATAYSVFAIKCVVAPDIPNNMGSLAPFVVVAPDNSIVNAKSPSPVNCRHIVGQLLSDLVLGCAHKMSPGTVPAEGTSVLWDLPMRGGFSPHENPEARPFVIELVHNGGTGARPRKDGLSTTAYPSGVKASQIEITETTTPLIVLQREYRTDSGGAGQQRGGLGQIIRIASTDQASFLVSGKVDRVKYPARGREGGANGKVGKMGLKSGLVFSGKGVLEVPPGDELVVETPGGGGYGNPLSRSRQQVQQDLKQGLISQTSATETYGL